MRRARAELSRTAATVRLARVALVIARLADIGGAPTTIARDRKGEDETEQDRPKNDRKNPAAGFFHDPRLACLLGPTVSAVPGCVIDRNPFMAPFSLVPAPRLI